MVNYAWTEFALSEDRWHLATSIEGYERWTVVLEAIVGTTGAPVLAELAIYPRQHQVDDGTGALGWKPVGPGEEPGRNQWGIGGAERAWSGKPEDVPPGGIPARLLRRVNAGELLDLGQRRALEMAKVLAEEYDLGDTSGVQQLAAVGRARRQKTGRAGHGVAYYLEWAVRYVELVRAGSRTPIKTLAEETGEKEAFVRDTLQDARRRHHLLSDPGRGRAGGHLTEKALKLLAEKKKTQLGQSDVAEDLPGREAYPSPGTGSALKARRASAPKREDG